MTKYREMSCGEPWKIIKSQLSTLPSSRICTRMRRCLSGHVMATPLTDFPINIGLHQGLAMSPYLFALVMDDVTRDKQDDILWCMLFADDAVLVYESWVGLK